MPTVVLVDDEPSARRGLRRLLSTHEDVEVLGEAEDVASAVALLKTVVPDAVFLDVEMPGGQGFDLLRALPAKTKVVFVTAHSQHGPRAFEVEALDYLLKPVRPERLAHTLERLRRTVAVNRVLEDAPSAETRLSVRDQLWLRISGKVVMVPVEKICALEAEGDFTRFLLEGDRPLLGGDVWRSL